jgi:hypothetical protein
MLEELLAVRPDLREPAYSEALLEHAPGLRGRASVSVGKRLRQARH